MFRSARLSLMSLESCSRWLVLALLLLPLGPNLAAENAEVAERQGRLLNDIKYLASDDLEGRGVGTQGLNLASEYIKTQFAKAGLDVSRVNGDAYHKFNLITDSKLGAENHLAIRGPADATLELKLGENVQVGAFGGTGKFSAPIVFCGYGIVAEDAQYDDFANIDVAGKVVLLMRRNPRQGAKEGPFAGHGGMRHADLRTKMMHCASRNAAAVIVVNDVYSLRQQVEKALAAATKTQADVATQAEAFADLPTDDAAAQSDGRAKLVDAVNKWKTARAEAAKPAEDKLMPFGYAANNDGKPMLPAFHLSQAAVNTMLKATLNKSLEELADEIDRELKPRSAVLEGWTATGETTIDFVRTDVANVVGVIEGEGPLADETIVVGAHYDHVGRGGANSLAPGSNEIHNGADDNGSGTVSLLELARYFGKHHPRPPRRMVFIAFTAEELGLLGSARYVKDPVFPLDKTIAMFNLDMIGRLADDKLTVYGAGTSSRWESELSTLNERDFHFQLALKPEGFGPSDQASFYGEKIPVLHYFSGTHSDYHRPTDDWDKLNIEGMAKIVGFVAREVEATLANPTRPDYIEVQGSANPVRGGSRPYVGTIPDFGSELPGYAINGAAPGSPADKAGMKAGDRIVKFGKHAINSLEDYDNALRDFKAGDEVEVTVARKGEEVKLKVVLDPPR